MNVNTFQMMGLVVKISMRPVKAGSKEKVGTLMIRYGEKRDMRKNKRVQYVNAAKLKIPPKTAPMMENIKPGDIVSVMGRIQGLARGGDIESMLVISSCKLWSPKMMGYDLAPLGSLGSDDTGDDDADREDEDNAVANEDIEEEETA